MAEGLPAWLDLDVAPQKVLSIIPSTVHLQGPLPREHRRRPQAVHRDLHEATVPRAADGHGSQEAPDPAGDGADHVHHRLEEVRQRVGGVPQAVDDEVRPARAQLAEARAEANLEKHGERHF